MRAVAVVGGVVLLGLVSILSASAAFPGKPGRIVFVRDRPAGIYTMNASGGDVRLVLSGEALSVGGPVWSPDGTRIAFVGEAPSDPPSENVTFTINVVNADGTGLRRVTPVPSGALGRPSWSPDGRWIAYSTGQDGEATIHVINLDDSRDAQLTQPSLSAESPAWSPDGSRIAFSALPGGRPWETCLMRSDGSQQRCFRHRGWQELQQSWSPDGRRLLVSATDSRGHGGTMLIMNADGSHRLNLSRRFGSGYYPSLSPDGRKLLDECQRNGRIHICVGDLRSGRIVDLTPESSFDSEPDWQRLPGGSRSPLRSVPRSRRR